MSKFVAYEYYDYRKNVEINLLEVFNSLRDAEKYYLSRVHSRINCEGCMNRLSAQEYDIAMKNPTRPDLLKPCDCYSSKSREQWTYVTPKNKICFQGFSAKTLGNTIIICEM